MDNRTRLLETALLEYVEKYGATENARRAMIQSGLLDDSLFEREKEAQQCTLGHNEPEHLGDPTNQR